MRRLLTLFLFLFSVFYSFAIDSYNEISGSGLYINSVPQNAKVFIDGVERGLTPYNVSSIRSGEYNIRIEKEGYTDRRFRVVINRGSRVEISVDLEEAKGQLLLEIGRDPESPLLLEFNPRITVDGSSLPVDSTTLFYEQNVSLPAGWRTIAVEAFGWERVSTRILIEEGSTKNLRLVLKPASFALTNAVLRKKRFNPQNRGALGNAEINFMVNAPGMGILEVLNEKGTVIYSKPLGPFTTWQQQTLWDGKHNSGEFAGDGRYTIRVSGWKDEGAQKQSAELSVQVDTSIAMRPLSIASSVAGLLLVPSPEALPAFSYQIDGSLMAGKPLLGNAWKSLPFAIGLRVSFLDNLEAAAVLNAAPGFSENSEWGAGASVKWVFFRPQNSTAEAKNFLDALGLAAEVSYGWATLGPYTAFGMGTGAGLRLPALYRLLNGNTENSESVYSFDLLLSPLVLWASEKGYPDTVTPRLGIEGGALFTYGSIAAGVSLRWDYETQTKLSGPLVTAVEFKFFPSNFVISALGGFWYLPSGKNSGGFFGVGLGVLY